jgi:hypothetical protein
MTDEELTAFLRDLPFLRAAEAADRIEALTKERGEAMAMARKVSRTNIKYVAGKIAAEAKLAECEARLGKAVEVLTRLLATAHADDHDGWQDALKDARATLAEIESSTPYGLEGEKT